MDFTSGRHNQLNSTQHILTMNIMMLVMVIINMAMTINCMNMVVPQRLKFTTLVQPFLKWSHDLGDRICRAEVYRAAGHEMVKVWSARQEGVGEAKVEP